MKTSTKGLLIVLGILLTIAVVSIVIVFVTGSTSITREQFMDELYDGRYTAVSQNNDVWTATDASGKRYEVVMHNVSNEDVDSILNYQYGKTLALRLHDTNSTLSDVEKNAEWDIFRDSTEENYKIFVDEQYTTWASYAELKFEQNNRYAVSLWDYAYPVIMILFFVLIAFFLYRSMRSTGNVASNFGKSKANVSSTLKVRFSDVAGAEEEKEELAEIVEFLKTPAKFSAVGARVPRGVLLVGPPGTGKTLFAKAIAGEANVPFFSISGSDFVEMFVGVGASRVRDLFDQAKKSQPCIVFIDEIDAVGRQRGAGLGGGNDEREQTLNQLLVQMDGFETNENVIVVAATNRADILDPALMRPGRFDRQIYVNVPDVRGREAIFKVHARNKPISREIDFHILARMTSGFTGADIANLLNEAAILCARAGRHEIIMEDVYEGINKVILGAQKKSRLITEVDKRITAYHEGGHAIVAKKLEPYCEPVQEISIIPRGPAGGYTLCRPDNDNNHIMYKELEARLAMGMGGRCAEEIVIQDISAGASGDIKQGTELAHKMVTEWGMSNKVGPVFFGGSEEVFLGRDYGASHSYSESTAAAIDAEVSRLIKEAHDKAYDIIAENREILDTLVRVLFEKETIYSDEFDLIMKGATAEEAIAYIDKRIERKTVNKSDTAKA